MCIFPSNMYKSCYEHKENKFKNKILSENTPHTRTHLNKVLLSTYNAENYS